MACPLKTISIRCSTLPPAFTWKGTDDWAVKRTGGGRAPDVFSTQAEAIKRAKELRSAGESAIERVRNTSSDTPERRKKKRPSELFAPLRGLDIDFSRNPSTGCPVEL